MKQWARWLLCLGLFWSWSGLESAAAVSASPQVVLNHVQLATKAVTEDGEVYLPVRNICESLGYSVSWSQDKQAISMISQDKSIVLNLKESQIAAGDHLSFLPKRPVVIQERTFMPLEFFADHLALRVDSDLDQGIIALQSVIPNAVSVKTVKVSEQVPGLKITQQFPQIDGNQNKEVEDHINRLFQEAAEQSATEGRKNAAELAQYREEHGDGSPNPCEVYFDYQVKYNHNNLLCVVLQDYQYAGGAHGRTVQTSYTISLDTGLHYTLGDWFQEGADYVSFLSANVKEQLEARNLTSALFEPFNQIDPNQNYYISNRGLTVYFQQYDILPYTAGIQEFTVDFVRLQDWLKYPEIFK